MSPISASWRTSTPLEPLSLADDLFLAAQPGEELRHRDFFQGMDQLGGDLEQRHQDEAALTQARVRDDQFRRRQDQVPGQQDVDVDGPVPVVGILQVAPLLQLMNLAFFQQVQRSQTRFQMP